MISLVTPTKETFTVLRVFGTVMAVYEEVQSGDLLPIWFAQVNPVRVIISDAPYKNIRVEYACKQCVL